MKEAVVESFDSPPRFADVEAPVPWPDEIVLSVRAAALTQLARVLAAGKHDAAGKPPFVPGTDGVGEVEGRRMYFVPARAVREHGRARRRKGALRGAGPRRPRRVTAAAAANAGMTS